MRLAGIGYDPAGADTASVPPLTLTETSGRVRLQFGGLARGEGATLQEASDDLVQSILSLALALRSSGFQCSRELQPDLETMSFLYELGEIAASGRDIRPALFG
jgi:hypothetical protein